MPAKTVLIVDDEPDNRNIISSVVEEVGGYQVLVADDGEQALSLIASNHPDLILLDLRLPGVDGFEVARRLKNHPTLRTIPILALSALTRSNDRRQAMQVGCDDYVDKPFNVDELVQKIKRLLDPSPTPTV